VEVGKLTRSILRSMYMEEPMFLELVGDDRLSAGRVTSFEVVE